MQTIDFSTIEYLKIGNEKQIKAFEILTRYNVLSNLSAFDPILVGTFPIDIAIENSDLDIICYWKDKTDFMETIKGIYSNELEFKVREILLHNQETIIANFKISDFEVEIFGQNIPTEDQNGYKHMIIEHEILRSKGEKFRLDIIKLKQNGYKTEPAFALLLDLKGNPYEALLDYKIDLTA